MTAARSSWPRAATKQAPTWSASKRRSNARQPSWQDHQQGGRRDRRPPERRLHHRRKHPPSETQPPADKTPPPDNNRPSDPPPSEVKSPTASVRARSAPLVSISVTPSSPVVGTVVTFRATTDINGNATITWDLDNDGRFDATGRTAKFTFSTRGDKVITVRATDTKTGLSTRAFQTVTVAPAPDSPLASPPVTPPVTSNPTPAPDPPIPTVPRPRLQRLMAPFPIVRLRGRVYQTYTKFDMVSGCAPRGARTLVRCDGRSCTRRASIARVRQRTHWTRFRRLERRVVAGTVLEIFVTQRRRIGKYTRFEVRAGNAPLRRDRCLSATAAGVRVMRCPVG